MIKEIVYVKIVELNPAPYNPCKWSEDAIRDLMVDGEKGDEIAECWKFQGIDIKKPKTLNWLIEAARKELIGQ